MIGFEITDPPKSFLGLRIFWYNICLPWRNWKLRRAWIAQGRDPAMFGKIGRFDKNTYEWALNAARKIRKRSSQKRR